METAEQKASKWLIKNNDLIRGIDLSAYPTQIIPKLILLLKEQDRDTRHACAEACLVATTGEHLELVSKAYHDICMNVKAV